MITDVLTATPDNQNKDNTEKPLTKEQRIAEIQKDETILFQSFDNGEVDTAQTFVLGVEYDNLLKVLTPQEKEAKLTELQVMQSKRPKNTAPYNYYGSIINMFVRSLAEKPADNKEKPIKKDGQPVTTPGDTETGPIAPEATPEATARAALTAINIAAPDQDDIIDLAKGLEKESTLVQFITEAIKATADKPNRAEAIKTWMINQAISLVDDGKKQREASNKARNPASGPAPLDYNQRKKATPEGKEILKTEDNIDKIVRKRIEKIDIKKLFPDDPTYFNHLAINTGEVKKNLDDGTYTAQYVILKEKEKGQFTKLEQPVTLTFDKAGTLTTTSVTMPKLFGSVRTYTRNTTELKFTEATKDAREKKEDDHKKILEKMLQNGKAETINPQFDGNLDMDGYYTIFTILPPFKNAKTGAPYTTVLQHFKVHFTDGDLLEVNPSKIHFTTNEADINKRRQ
ncbi:MAG: hypothetical protein WCG98_08840 [bacterium]